MCHYIDGSSILDALNLNLTQKNSECCRMILISISLYIKKILKIKVRLGSAAAFVFWAFFFFLSPTRYALFIDHEQ